MSVLWMSWWLSESDDSTSLASTFLVRWTSAACLSLDTLRKLYARLAPHWTTTSTGSALVPIQMHESVAL